MEAFTGKDTDTGKVLDKVEIKAIFDNLDKKLPVSTEEKDNPQFIEGSYNFKYQCRGLVLVIVNAVLDGAEGIAERRLYLEDGERMEKVVSQNPFNYKYLIKFTDVTLNQMVHIFKCASELKGLKGCSSFIFHFAGHGSIKTSKDNKNEDREFIHSCEGEPFNIARIADYFSDRKCEGLCGKPKIFFIDACRNDENELVLYDEGLEFEIAKNPVDETDKNDKLLDVSNSSPTRRLRDFENITNIGSVTDEDFSTVCPVNFLIVRSCIKYQRADPRGFISIGMELAIGDYSSRAVDLIDFLTYASGKVAQIEVPEENVLTEKYIKTLRFLSIQHKLLADIIYYPE